MMKFLLQLLLVIAILSLIPILIPDAITSNLDNAIVWLLIQVKNADMFIDTNVFFECLRIVSNVTLGLGLFWAFDWVMDHTK